MNLQNMKYFQTHQDTEACYVFLILPFYDNEMFSLLVYVIYTLEYLKFRSRT